MEPKPLPPERAVPLHVLAVWRARAWLTWPRDRRLLRRAGFWKNRDGGWQSPPRTADAPDPRLPGPLMAALDAWLRLTGPWDRWQLRRRGWTDAGGGNWEPPDTDRRTSFRGTVNPPLEGNE